jgi:hypothetical protein
MPDTGPRKVTTEKGVQRRAAKLPKKDFLHVLRTAGARKKRSKRQMSSSRTRSTWRGTESSWSRMASPETSS